MANYRKVARRAAARHGLDPRIFERQIQQESGFRPRVSSPAGAQGIAQIMPATAKGWGVNPNNPKQALNAAAKNMASYVRKYGGYENALRAYNAGPGRIQASKGFGETNHYVATILKGKDPKRLGRPARGGGGGGGGGGRKGRPGRTVQGADTRIVTKTPGTDNSAARMQLVQSFLSDRKADPVDFALGIKGLKDVEASSSTQRIPGTDWKVPGRAGRAGGQRGRGAGGGGRKGPVDLTPRGGYKGTNGPISDFSRLGKGLGLQVSSSKRNNTNPYSGNRSDHDFGNKDATARDMSNGGAPTPQMDAYAKRVADALGINYKKGTPINKRVVKNGVRYQLIYRGTGAAFGGNHMNHVHLGAKRVGRGGSSKGVL